MTTQFKKGVLELVVLLAVTKKDMYGYELVSEDALTLTAGTYRHPKKPEDLVERNLEEERGK